MGGVISGLISSHNSSSLPVYANGLFAGGDRGGGSIGVDQPWQYSHAATGVVRHF